MKNKNLYINTLRDTPDKTYTKHHSIYQQDIYDLYLSICNLYS